MVTFRSELVLGHGLLTVESSVWMNEPRVAHVQIFRTGVSSFPIKRLDYVSLR